MYVTIINHMQMSHTCKVCIQIWILSHVNNILNVWYFLVTFHSKHNSANLMGTLLSYENEYPDMYQMVLINEIKMKV